MVVGDLLFVVFLAVVAVAVAMPKAIKQQQKVVLLC